MKFLEPPFLIMDEPTSGLDYFHMKQVANVMKMLKQNSKTILVITHDNELISCCADFVLELKNGKVAL